MLTLVMYVYPDYRDDCWHYAGWTLSPEHEWTDTHEVEFRFLITGERKDERLTGLEARKRIKDVLTAKDGGFAWLTVSKDAAELDSKAFYEWLIDSAVVPAASNLEWLRDTDKLEGALAYRHDYIDQSTKILISKRKAHMDAFELWGNCIIVSLTFAGGTENVAVPSQPSRRISANSPRPSGSLHHQQFNGPERLTIVMHAPGIEHSLARFRKDYPNESKVAFIMMRFGTTKAHQMIVAGIRNALTPLGITGLRADDKEYHNDLFSNLLTYIYGCSFGIAVFERIESKVFNPNVSLEVGYMFGLGKQVCLLKDGTLKTLPADLMGKLYRSFDPQDPENTIPTELTRWLKDWGHV